MTANDPICRCGKRRSKHSACGGKLVCYDDREVSPSFDPDPAFIVGTDEYRARLESEGQLNMGETT